MSELCVNRSVQFVSLDTHPANNALVVTYEILVSVIDQQSQRELSRRNKRNQFLINISALNDERKLDEKNKLINLQELSNDIVRKCPLLLSGRSNLEEIQLHLIYLISRRQSQLQSAARNSNDLPTDRPQSRLRSASSLGSARVGSAIRNVRNSEWNNISQTGKDVYTNFYMKELQNSGKNVQSVDRFLDEFNEHLDQLQQIHNLSQPTLNGDNLDSHLEGLYGDSDEKLSAVSHLRSLSNLDERLIEMSKNKLLICAMIRTLRDIDNAKDNSKANIYLSESIIYCLLRLTLFDNVYKALEANDSSLADDMSIGIVALNLLVAHVEGISQKPLDSSQDHPLRETIHYYTKSLLHLIMNLFNLSGGQQTRIEQKILAKNQPQYLTALVELFQIVAKVLTSELSEFSATSGDTIVMNLIDMLHLLMDILQRLSIFKEFTVQLRSSKSSASFLSSLVNLLGTLQLIRSGSGSSNLDKHSSGGGKLLYDQQTLNSIFGLEINLLKLVNNLIFDSRLKLRLLKRNLLKCVLRNLVVFLATRNQQQQQQPTKHRIAETNSANEISFILLSPYESSAILLVPFKSLYELSCNESVKLELFKSKIIIKCLLEYLLSCTLEFRSNLAVLHESTSSITDDSNRIQKQQLHHHSGGKNKNETDLSQILIEPNNVCHYIVALWVNLSGHKEAPIYSPPSQLQANESERLLVEYIELSIENLTNLLVNNRTMNPMSNNQGNLSATKLIMFMHMKLLRNFTQFLAKFDRQLQSDWIETTTMTTGQVSSWCERLAKSTNHLLMSSQRNQSGESTNLNHSLTVECLATLSNMLLILGKFNEPSSDCMDQINEMSMTKLSQVVQLYEQLFLHHLRATISAENSDYDSSDDLLLVSMGFLANLAQTNEICKPQTSQIDILALRLIEYMNFILESRMNDCELVVSALYSLCQLMNHCDYLNEFSALSDDATNAHKSEPIALEMSKLADKLASLLLTSGGSDDNCSKSMSKLANFVLTRLKQLDEQHNLDESLIHRQRFVGYNGKWLAAIRASREEKDVGDLGTTSASGRRAVSSLSMSSTGKLGDIDLDQAFSSIVGEQNIRTIDERASCTTTNSGSSGSGSTNDSKRYHRMQRPLDSKVKGELNHEEDNSDLDDDDDEDEDEFFEDDDLELHNSGELRCDSNVIDPHSMIKHLTNTRSDVRK